MASSPTDLASIFAGQEAIREQLKEAALGSRWLKEQQKYFDQIKAVQSQFDVVSIAREQARIASAVESVGISAEQIRQVALHQRQMSQIVEAQRTFLEGQRAAREVEATWRVLEQARVNEVAEAASSLSDWVKSYATANSAVQSVVVQPQSTETLERARVDLLGKSGSIRALAKQLSDATVEERREIGPVVNNLKDDAEAIISAKRKLLEEAALDAQLKSEALDLTLPAPPRRVGALHPTLRTMDEMIAIFAEMGFAVAEGPDIEDDFHNFTALNFPPKHPAREMHDTFFFARDANGERKVLRTHTSPVQVRTMMSQSPPIRIIAPGRTYRCDSDQTHTPMFHQVEGLVIDRDIHMGHLKWTLDTFVARFFETAGVVTRFRPHHFPFTEPSAEMDVQCDRSGGRIVVGQGTDWLEVVGCGMVHPNVLRNCGVDPDEWQGFAFGFGVDRLAMLKYGMPDLRDMFASDTRWLAHYGFSPFAALPPLS